MASQVDSAAAAIAAALAPQPPSQFARWRWGTVTSVNADGTLDVSVGGSTMPSVRRARHVAASVGSRVRVSYLGTDAFVDAVRAVSNYPLLMRDLGTNPVKTTATDTTQTWNAMGSGVAWYNVAGQLNGQPSRYGFLLSETNGYDTAQIWKEQRDGGLYVRGGNLQQGLTSWHLIPYVMVFYAASGRATITLPRDTRHLIISSHNSTPELNGIALVTGSTVWKLAGASSITYTHSGTTVTAVASTGGNPAYYLIPLE